MSISPQTIGRYRILEKLGEGGMGVVYAAHDDRLDRRLALKTIRITGDPSLRDRFWREARAAASVSHPNVCPIYEVGEAEDGSLFLAMELLAGESLGTRLGRGPIPIEQALRIECDVLAALDAIHARGLVHRDLKPSNVHLTPHGVKLLDFGLARPMAGGEVAETGITQPGVVLGTPRYMAPEQVTGQTLDGRADLFAAGALLYEMLSGHYAFEGETMMQVMHAVVYETPPPLEGPPPSAEVDQVIRRALAKTANDRFESAAAMATALRQAAGESVATPSSGELAVTRITPTRPNTRLVVLPFRMLRPDPEIDFLAFSLADAVSSALAGISSLTVRPSLTSAPLSGDAPDISRIAREANVDVVLTGTLLRAGPQLRVTTQLLQAPSGTLLASHTSQAPLGDLFQLQDELAQRIVDALSLPLTQRDRRQARADVPADPAAYELYLRANQLATDPSKWDEALELYRACVSKDANYAPAWARLGRMARVMAKFGDRNRSELIKTAESAFRRALELNPDFSAAHHLQVYLEVELGRARFAMIRLLDRARARRDEAELYSGLVIACRYCGLLEASIAAHEQALKLDPGVRTSIPYTRFFQLDWERVVSSNDDPLRFPNMIASLSLGRVEEAKRIAEAATRNITHLPYLRSINGYLAAGAGDAEKFRDAMDQLRQISMHDPEAFLLMARSASRMGFQDEAIRFLDRSVRGGHFCPSFMRRDPWLEGARSHPEFERIVADATRLRSEARAHYLAAGGESLLGVGTAGEP